MMIAKVSGWKKFVDNRICFKHSSVKCKLQNVSFDSACFIKKNVIVINKFGLSIPVTI